MSSLVPVKVSQIEQITPIIREFTLEAIDQPLLPFSSGSHVVVSIPLQDRILRNAYSLLSDPYQDQHYKIAVRLQEDSRGGSRYLHQEVKVGDVLKISAPLNLFSLHSQAKHHVFIAGGIGITPFMSHIRQLVHSGGSFELHYACRDQLSNAYESVLNQLFPTQLQVYSERTECRLDVLKLLQQQDLHTHVYICGPDRLIQAVQQAAQQLGWSKHRVHWEAFASPPAGTPFKAKLSKSQKTIEVASDYSLLEALEAQGVEVPSLCRGGVCGQCALKYKDGEVDHHDHFLNIEERQHLLMPCVSRAKYGSCIELDL
ncbi:PDR/VanB family oxidoreductase [Acinetobacter baumannii]|uniref:2Fe-2S iron-sulfur cluster binding domain-containing protein n=1 Tax=Acinetobacter baumannii TaxID=470 RepID=A0A505MQA2_ACIBA|nr:PDR/VanB family oxidoreductase [Acinetobacter baumannii]EJB8497450.1 oxidoreductase [Acinetobacter baumannii]ELB0341909.1 oxidoreductase [Acinetobacter baumannii]KCY24567.1 2Fe-2S iron-sulfur cluster binding domain protein [Acinetobacter baumannii 233846]MCJ8816211.1 PDR/VanB family oxidoreductase [Acinetobacter baumannii]MCJ8987341.1 PDR/VanB family oxidoreductase [Acinetobacter baumannii]